MKDKKPPVRSYVELLKDPRWQKVRLQILERDSWACSVCEASDRTLHVHHTKYERGKMPWEANQVYLVTLCEDCHESATHWKRAIDSALAEVSPAKLSRIAGYIQGQLLRECPSGPENIEVTDYEQAVGILQSMGEAQGEIVLDRLENGHLSEVEYDAIGEKKP